MAASARNSAESSSPTRRRGLIYAIVRFFSLRRSSRRTARSDPPQSSLESKRSPQDTSDCDPVGDDPRVESAVARSLELQPQAAIEPANSSWIKAICNSFGLCVGGLVRADGKS